MEFLFGLALFAASWFCYNLTSRVDRLERELSRTKRVAEQALELAHEAHARPEYESEMDKMIRQRRRENMELGILPTCKP